MHSEVSVDRLNEVENLSKNSVKKVEKYCGVVEAKDNGDELSLPSKGVAIGPITPDSNKETGDFIFGFSSPLTMVSSPQNDNLHASIDFSSPRTPVEGVFDPFAPGPEKLMMAPHCKKYLQETRSNYARQLRFDSSVNFVRDGNCETDAETISDDEMFLETVYATLLEAIVSNQTEGLVTEILPLDPGFDGFKTPDSATCLRGIAETCPGAPLKTSGTTRKLRNIDQGLCRKLEF